MIEETAAPVEQPDAAPAATEANQGEHVPESQTARPEGWERLDYSELPPELAEKVQRRINRYHGQVKTLQAQVHELTDNQRRVYERLENWEMGQAQASTQARLAELEKGWKQAISAGATDRAWALQIEASDLRAQQHRVPPPRQEPPRENLPQLAQDEAVAIGEWAQARPFAKDGSEWQQWTATQLQELYVHPKWKDAPIEDKLDEVDRRFKAQRPQQAAVLDGKGGSRPKSSGPKLSDAQQAVARRIFSNLSPQEAYVRYAKGLA